MLKSSPGYRGCFFVYEKSTRNQMTVKRRDNQKCECGLVGVPILRVNMLGLGFIGKIWELAYQVLNNYSVRNSF
jgi:hypothetical protein